MSLDKLPGSLQQQVCAMLDVRSHVRWQLTDTKYRQVLSKARAWPTSIHLDKRLGCRFRFTREVEHMINCWTREVIVESYDEPHHKCACNNDTKEYDAISKISMAALTSVHICDFRLCRQLAPNDDDKRILEYYKGTVIPPPPTMSNRSVSAFARKWLTVFKAMQGQLRYTCERWNLNTAKLVEQMSATAIRVARLPRKVSAVDRGENVQLWNFEKAEEGMSHIRSATVKSARWDTPAYDDLFRIQEAKALECLSIIVQAHATKDVTWVPAQLCAGSTVASNREAKSMQRFFCTTSTESHDCKSLILHLCSLCQCPNLHSVFLEVSLTKHHFVILKFVDALRTMFTEAEQHYKAAPVFPSLRRLVLTIYIPGGLDFEADGCVKILKTLADKPLRSQELRVDWAIVIQEGKGATDASTSPQPVASNYKPFETSVYTQQNWRPYVEHPELGDISSDPKSKKLRDGVISQK